jgi:hypothetical protein
VTGPFSGGRMDKFQEIVNDLPEKRARSRLDPYADLIRDLINRGWTYREVARILREKCGVQTSFSTLHYFVRTRFRSKSKKAKIPLQILDKSAEVSAVRNGERLSAILGNDTTVNDAVYRRIAALKQRQQSSEKSSKQFHYDPEEPLHISSPPPRREPGE